MDRDRIGLDDQRVFFDDKMGGMGAVAADTEITGKSTLGNKSTPISK
jgi:hypothetical protein